MKKWICVLAISMGCVAMTSQAADITWGWGTPADVAAVSDVTTNGTLVEAFNLGASTRATDVTVNGVLFTAKYDFLANDIDVNWLGVETTGNANYDELLSNGDYGEGDGLLTKSVGNGNLVGGSNYLIQVWYVDSRNANNLTMRFGDGNGNTVDITSNPGQYVVGTFTADDTSQTLTLDAQGVLGNATITGYQLRDLTGIGLGSEDLAQVGVDGGSWGWNFGEFVGAEFNGTADNARASLYTVSPLQNDLGFTLDVEWFQPSVGLRVSFGIVDSSYTVNGGNGWLTQAMPGAYGIGFVPTGGLISDNVLAFNDGTTAVNDFDSLTELSTAQGANVLDTLQTMSITVTHNSWSYSLNDAAATTGSFTFDTSRSYRFISYVQTAHSSGTDLNGFYFSNINLVPIHPLGTVISIQ